MTCRFGLVHKKRSLLEGGRLAQEIERFKAWATNHTQFNRDAKHMAPKTWKTNYDKLTNYLGFCLTFQGLQPALDLVTDAQAFVAYLAFLRARGSSQDLFSKNINACKWALRYYQAHEVDLEKKVCK